MRQSGACVCMCVYVCVNVCVCVSSLRCEQRGLESEHSALGSR